MLRQVRGVPRSLIRYDHLVGRLGRERPEVPLHVVAAQAGVGQALLRVDEVGELHRVTHEEDRRVVADEVVVAFLGVELEGEAAHVAVRVRVALFGGHRREAHEHRRALADFVEEGGLGPLADVGGHLEVAERAAALDVVHAIGDALADEVGQLLDQVGILQQHGSGRADRERVLVAGARAPASVVVGGCLLISFSSDRARPGTYMGRLKHPVVFASQLLGPGAVHDDLDEVDPLEARHEVG